MLVEKYKKSNGITFEIIPFKAGDGFECNLIHATLHTKIPSKGPVLLVHGAGVSASIFLPPHPNNIVNYLLNDGYDVWLENWRASIDFKPNPWTLDQAALYDHPYAVKKLVELTGVTSIKAVVHCQGSTSFMMALVTGKLPQVSNVISNAVSLHPIVPRFSRFKLSFLTPIVHSLTDYLNPQWGYTAPTFTAKLVKGMVRLTHHECDNEVCKQVSFTYGSGFPALWKHENLSYVTHDWIKQQFKHVPLTFYRQMTHSVRKKQLTSYDRKLEFPEFFAVERPKTYARVTFISGNENQCFLKESQIKSFEFFDKHNSNYHSLHIFPNYSHLDIFIGVNAEKEVFPVIVKELDK